MIIVFHLDTFWFIWIDNFNFKRSSFLDNMTDVTAAHVWVLGSVIGRLDTKTHLVAVRCWNDDEHSKILFLVIGIYMFCDCSWIVKMWWWKPLLPRLRHHTLHLDHQKWRASLLPLDGLPVFNIIRRWERKILWSHPDLWHSTGHGGSLLEWKNNGWGCCPDWKPKCYVWIDKVWLQINLQGVPEKMLPCFWGP